VKLSRKPRNIAVLLVTVVFLLSFAAVAGAWQINMGTINSYYYPGGNVTGTVYTTGTADAIYARVYATIDGTQLTTAVANNVYDRGTIAIPLVGLTTGWHSVSLSVYEGANVSSYTYRGSYAPFNVYVTNPPPSSGGGGGGGAVTTPTTPTTPSLSATFGSPVGVSATTGGTINSTGVTINIPAGALAADVKVTISKLASTAGLKLDAASKLVSDVLEIIKDKTGNFSKPITITLSFDKSKVDTDKFDLKVCYYDEENDKWVPLDSISVDLANGKVSGNTTHFTKFAVIAFPKEAAKPETKGLSDIAGHWAEDSIKQLVATGAISGYPNGTFKPNNSITRAEFATVVVKAFKLNAANGKVFADTSNHWAKSYIATAEAAGIVSGYGNNKFGPDDLITREQMAVMIVKAANLTGGNGKTFTDSAKISSWAKSAVSTANATGVISGFPDGSFKPQDKATRAQAVTVIVNAQK